MANRLRTLGPVIVALALLAGRSTAEPKLFPFQYNGRDFMAKDGDAFAQSMYIEGLADALMYITPENAIGAQLSECFHDGPRIGSQLLILLTRNRIEELSEPEPIVASLMYIMRAGCERYLKKAKPDGEEL